MIRPVCTPLPKVKTVEPDSKITAAQDSKILITFNKSVDPASFGDFFGLSITSNGIPVNEYFATPEFFNDNTTLSIVPLAATDVTKLLLPPDESVEIKEIQVSYIFSGETDSVGNAIKGNLEHKYRINKDFEKKKTVKVLVEAESEQGKFLSSGLTDCTVNYTFDIQFTVKKSAYSFTDFEAVSINDNKQSRMSSVQFENKEYDDETGVYKARVRVKDTPENTDILIRPVCIERPKVVGIEPEFLYVTYNQDSVIKFSFNKALNKESIVNFTYYIFADRDINNKFERPILSQDGKTLFIHPKAGEHIIQPDGNENVLNLKIDYDFTKVVDLDGLALTSKGSHEYKINKSFTGEQIAKVFIPAKNSSGYFSSSGEKSCTVGYSLELQYTLTDAGYTFVDFEAVSNDGDNSVSRNSSVSFEDKYYNQEAGMFRAKLFVNELYDDILIRPVLKEVPGVINHTTTSGSETLSLDKPVKIEFNTQMDAQEVLNNISVICKTNDESLLQTYFNEPVYDASDKVLTLVPKPLLLKEYLDTLHLGTVDLQISLDKTIRNSTFTIRYKAEYEQTVPRAVNFIVVRNQITLENVSETNEDYKLSLKAIDITAAQIPSEDIQKNRAGNGSVYIYGSYFDEESGVKDVVVSSRMLQDNGELTSATNSTYDLSTAEEIVKFESDGQGNTSFVIKYDFASLGKAYVLDVIVRDNCNNASAVKTVSVFVPVYGQALGEYFYYLKNMPDYKHEDLTIEEYSAELKNLKIYPDAFTVYKNVKFPADELTIYCEYKDKTGANKKQKFNLNKGENPYWNCPLNVTSLADLNVKITVYDGQNIYDQRNFKFPARTAFNIEWIDNRLHYPDPNYQIRILAEPEHSVFGIQVSSSADYPDGRVAYMESPLGGYSTLDLYTKYDWFLETSNQQGLYSDVVHFDDILEVYDTPVSGIEITDKVLDTSDWKTNGGFFVATITLADDTWEDGKYDHVFYSTSYSTGDIEVSKDVYTVVEKIPLSKLTGSNVRISFTGKKGFKKSDETQYTIDKVSGVDYDTTSPTVWAWHSSYDDWYIKLEDEYGGSGETELEFTIGNKSYHIDASNSLSEEELLTKIPAKDVEEARVQGDGICRLEYSGCDNAGNIASGTLVLDDGGQGSNLTIEKESSTSVQLTMDRDDYHYEDTQTKFYFYEFNSGTENWETAPSVSSTEEINYQYAGENHDIFRYQKTFYNLPENKFLKVLVYNSIYFPAPQYIYAGNSGTGDYDLLMQNASSKKSVIICSDAPVYVHTLVTKCPYEKCKAWDYSIWEYYKDDIGKKILNFSADKEEGGVLVTGDHNPKIYKIPYGDLDDGECYCVIAHFANGDVLMSPVMQK